MHAGCTYAKCVMQVRMRMQVHASLLLACEHTVRARVHTALVGHACTLHIVVSKSCNKTCVDASVQQDTGKKTPNKHYSKTCCRLREQSGEKKERKKTEESLFEHALAQNKRPKSAISAYFGRLFCANAISAVAASSASSSLKSGCCCSRMRFPLDDPSPSASAPAQWPLLSWSSPSYSS